MRAISTNGPHRVDASATNPVGPPTKAVEDADACTFVVADAAPTTLSHSPTPECRTIGHKSGNLLQVAKATRSEGLVPPLLPLSHEAMAHALAERGVPLDSLWAKFAESQGDSTSLKPAAACVLSDLRRLVTEAFANKPIVDLDTWLSAHADTRLMARSDGIEDTQTVTNAGGALSVANLVAHRAQVSRAIGQVIASYFEKRALLQRLDAGVDIRQPPLLSVFLQVMVGETLHGDVPMCGVMHTQDMEGPTPGLTVINAAYGHNEGVVNAGAVATDTTYVNSANNVVILDLVKDRRKVPNPNGGAKLLNKTNTYAMRAAPALTEAWAKRLAQVGRELEAHFGYPLDVEWTILSGQLYILQARPLVTPDTPPPSYVDGLLVEDFSQVHTDVICAAGAHVRQLNGPNSIVAAKTLRGALRLYLQRDDRRSVRAVVVGDTAPATSHEATTFRVAGIAVLRSDDGESLSAWLQEGTALVCPQSKRIVLIEKETEGPATHLGVIAHPMPASLSHVFLPDAAQQATILGEMGILSLDTVYASLQSMKTDTLFAWLGDPQEMKATWALTALVQRAIAQLIPLLKDRALHKPALNLAWSLLLQAQAVQRGQHTPGDRMTYLAAVNWLKACFTQTPGGNVLAADSLRSLRNVLVNRTALPLLPANTAAIAKPHAEALTRVELACLQREIRPKWRVFINALLTDKFTHAVPALATLVHQVNEAGVLPEWLRTHFSPAWDETRERLSNTTPNARAKATVAALLREFSTGKLGQVRALSAGVHELTSHLRNQIDAWGKPAHFPQLMTALKKLLNRVGYFAANGERVPGIIVHANAPDHVAQGLVSTQLHAVIDVIDASIKALIVSPAYVKDPRLKADHWFEALKSFTQLSASLLRRYAGDYSGMAQMVEQVLMKHLEKNLQATSDDDLESMFTNPTFFVERFTVGTASLPEIGSDAEKISLDFVFSVAHQNAVRGLALLAGPRLQQQLQSLPRSAIHIDAALQRASHFSDQGSRIAPKLVDIKTSSSQIDLSYAIPLRGHGASVDVQLQFGKGYQVLGGEVSMEMYGDSEDERRMERMLVYLGISAHAFGLAFAPRGEPHFEDAVLQVTWKLGADDFTTAKLSRVSRALAGLVDLSYMYANESDYLTMEEPTTELGPLLDLLEANDSGFVAHFDAIPDTFYAAYPYLNGELLEYIEDSNKRRRIAELTIEHADMQDEYWSEQVELCKAELPERPSKRARLR